MMRLSFARYLPLVACLFVVNACGVSAPTHGRAPDDLSLIGQGVATNDLAPEQLRGLADMSASASGCTLVTCASANAGCGLIGDGCGGTIDCGACTAPQTCGGGGTLFQCGGTAGCVPATCASIGASCGPAGDGCGNVIQCGTCSGGQTCGGGGQSSVCGGGVANDGGTSTCVPKTCAAAGATCGSIADGCGKLLDCGTCASGQTCGGGGVNSQCGSSACVPRTCASAGFNCGAAGDGCGNLIQCGTCAPPATCGGNGQANVCASKSLPPDAGMFVSCDGGATTIKGTVVAGTDPARGFGQPDPIYNAYVYVPLGPVQQATTGATCDRCANPQAAIVSAVTGVDGSFTLTNPPVGPNVTVVIQLGKWQRVLNLNVNACQTNVLTTDQTRLPRNHTEGNIPRFAFSTGQVDTLECVLRKMGIEDSEFVNPALDASGNPTAAGRVQLYQARTDSDTGSKGGAIISSTTPSESQLWGSQTTLNAYDAILFPCTGQEDYKSSAAQSRMSTYANAGGRVFTTHYSYVWLVENGLFANTANWDVGGTEYDSITGVIDQTFQKGIALAQWLQNAGASTTLGQIAVSYARRDFDSVIAPSQRWMSAKSPSFPIHYTFNTPVGATAANQCGRVVFSDFHVENSDGAYNKVFPKECAAGPLTPQERLLEFMLFDLTSCVAPDTGGCVPRTCADQGFGCGTQGDGCGNTIDCGQCTSPQTCGGGGTPAQCGGGCTPTTCDSQNIHCGPSGDGCGNIIQCGTCQKRASLWWRRCTGSVRRADRGYVIHVHASDVRIARYHVRTCG